MKRSLLALLAAALLSLAGCGSRTRAPAQDTAAAQRAAAWANTARALHHEADAYEDAGDLARARAAIERLLALPMPAELPDREALRADAFGRLGEILLDLHENGAALERLDAGLQQGRADSVLRARLLMVRGRALRALAQEARASNDSTREAQLRAQAIEALESSLAMNQRVLSSLTDGGRRP